MILVRSGKLVAEPLPLLLYSMYRDRLTGILSISGRQQADVYVRQGYPAGVTPAEHTDQLGEVLLSAKMLDPTAYENALITCIADGVLFGQSLVKAAVIKDEQLVEALRLQIRRRLHRLFLLTDGEFQLQTGEHWVGLEGVQPLRVQPRRVIYQGILGAWPPDRVKAALAPIEGKALRLTLDAPTMTRYGLSEAHSKIAAALQSPRTLEEAAEASGQPAPAVRAVIATLYFTEALELSEGEAVKSARPTPAPPPAAVLAPPPVVRNTPVPTATAASGGGAVEPPRRDDFGEDVLTGMAPSPLTALRQSNPGTVAPPRPANAPTTGVNLAGMREVIAAKLKAVDSGDLFEVLSLRRDADSAAVKAAYMLATKMLHPDRFTGQSLEQLRPQAERIFKRLTEAYVTLRDDDRRAQYLQQLEGNGKAESEQARVRAILDAEAAFLEGETRFKRRDFAGAIEPLGRAVAQNPDAGEPRAMWAWARYAASKATLAEVKPELRRAIQLSPDCARVHLYLGKALLQDNELEEAQKELKRAVTLDDRLDEGWTELRLVATRREKQRGFLDRPISELLKRK